MKQIFPWTTSKLIKDKKVIGYSQYGFMKKKSYLAIW